MAELASRPLDRPSASPAPEAGEVRRVVGALLGPGAVVETWSVEAFRQGWNPLTGGVFRVGGTARTPAGERAWSSVLKVVRPRAGAAPRPAELSSMFLWDREARLYASRILGAADGGLRPVDCLEVIKSADEARLWLRDQGADAGRWTLDDFVRAARELGRFHDRFRDLDAPPWLCRNLLRQWHDRHRDPAVWAVVADPRTWASPPVAAAFRRPLGEDVERLRAAWPAALDYLDHWPTVMSHCDLHRSNVFRGGQGFRVTDWSFAGRAPIGEDLSTLITANLFSLEWDLEAYLSAAETLLAAYRSGFSRHARHLPPVEDLANVVALASGLRYLPLLPMMLTGLVDADPATSWAARWSAERGLAMGSLVGRWAAVVRHVIEQAADAARRLGID